MKTKIDIISGFLGAGKTTLIKKFLEEKLCNEKIVIIENEFGEVGIDGTLLKKSGLEVKEINSGCICCTLVGDLENSIKEIMDNFKPERIIIEPSGVGKLSEIIKVCEIDSLKNITKVNMLLTVVDVERFNLHISNFGEFFENQIIYANTILLSRAQEATEEKIETVTNSIRKINPKASIVTNPWNSINGREIITLAENDLYDSIQDQDEIYLNNQLEIEKISYNNHCHHHHDAPEVFQVWGSETSKVFMKDEIKDLLNGLQDKENFGKVIRGKGILKIDRNKWILFDYIPAKLEVKEVSGDYTGRLCVIGTDLNKEQLKDTFNNIN